MIALYFGFHAPAFRDHTGRINPIVWFGHCEVWGYNADETWFFLDPQGKGSILTIEHRRDDVSDHLAARYILCHTILRWQIPARPFRLPIFPPMNCAGICGSFVGVRALSPAGLRRKLLRAGAEVIHVQTEREPRGSRSAPP